MTVDPEAASQRLSWVDIRLLLLLPIVVVSVPHAAGYVRVTPAVRLLRLVFVEDSEINTKLRLAPNSGRSSSAHSEFQYLLIHVNFMDSDFADQVLVGKRSARYTHFILFKRPPRIELFQNKSPNT